MVSSKSYEKIYRANVYFNRKGGYRRGEGYVLYGIVGIPSETKSGPVVLDATHKYSHQDKSRFAS